MAVLTACAEIHVFVPFLVVLSNLLAKEYIKGSLCVQGIAFSMNPYSHIIELLNTNILYYYYELMSERWGGCLEGPVFVF